MVDQDIKIVQNLKFEEYKYRIYAPLLNNAISFIGNIEKFASYNRLQFQVISIEHSTIILKICGIAEETIKFALVQLQSVNLNVYINSKKIEPGINSLNDEISTDFNSSACDFDSLSLNEYKIHFGKDSEIVFRCELSN